MSRIKSGVDKVAGQSGSGIPPLLLFCREQAAGIDQTQHSLVPLQFVYVLPRWPSNLSKGPSPGRPPFYADEFSKSPLRLQTTASINNFIMEVAPKPTRIIDSGRQTSMAKFQKYEPQIIVVVVDAKRKLRLSPLKYALDISEPGDKLYLLGILHQVHNPSTSPPKKSGGVIQNILHVQPAVGYKQPGEEQRKKEAEFERCLTNPGLQKLFASKQVKPEVQIAAGPDRKAVTARQAQELRAKWVILDKHLNSDKSYLMQKLNCNLVLMPKNQIPVMIKPAGNSPSGYQATLDDKSIDYGDADQQITNDMSPLRALLESFEKEASKSISQNTISAVPSIVSSSSDSLQHLDSMKISSQAPDLEHSPFDGQSARTEHVENQDVTAQFSDHDISPATGTSPTWLRTGHVAADSDRDRQTELGPGISSELEKSYSESDEDDFLTPAVSKVVSVGSSSEDVFYKTPGRPSMSTGDLQSLMPKSSSGAPLYRPAPRSASNKGLDELMDILNPTPSTPASAGAPRSVRTLQRSLQEEDLNLQSTDFPNSPVGRVNKFGSQNEDNRLLLDNSVHGRRNKPRPVAPSLCSHCKKPGPQFGRDAKRFTYAELEEATNNFDQENYIAEGGYGFVYKGLLEGGQEIAVKQYKAASSDQGDDEFDAEVEVLKHAQHRNLVILIGYCRENERRLLVYEFVCNKSLDVHLSAKNVNVLEWKWRWKIAVGAARGLRYLHEECRVGCIVHRDLRPNNILLTHDYVPMVGDFGLARSQTSGDEAEETRVIGTLGYLAPEYAESGSITEKADVYSFGVVLLELITGRKAIDARRARGETCLTEWARPVIQAGKTGDIVDPRLNNDYDVEQVNKMVDAAGRCVSKDPDQRPRMSEVLRLLERDANGDNSLSRGNSISDLVDITRQESLNKLQALTSGRRIHREASLNSVSSMASPKGNGASEHKGQLSSGSNNLQSTPNEIRSTRRIRTSKSEKLDSRTSSPRPSLLTKLTSTNSPIGKAAHGSKSKHKLSYWDMLP